ncbi:MAG: hypothetical protein ACK41P_09420 [Asticcacaulis sp.]
MKRFDPKALDLPYYCLDLKRYDATRGPYRPKIFSLVDERCMRMFDKPGPFANPDLQRRGYDDLTVGSGFDKSLGDYRFRAQVTKTQVPLDFEGHGEGGG